MKFDYKALIRLMKKSYKGGGIKIIRTERGLRDCFFLSGAGWALLIPKEKCPGEVTGQIVTWLADLPRIGYAAWVVKGFDPKPLEPAERDLCYCGLHRPDLQSGHEAPAPAHRDRVSGAAGQF